MNFTFFLCIFAKTNPKHIKLIMNKLQLYITKLSNGYKVLFTVNPSEEVTRHIRDLRKVVDNVTYDASEKNIFYYVTTVSTGTFITIIRTIPSTPGDHLAAWIFIPNELVIDAETLEKVVSVTARKVSGERVTTDDVASLRELYSAEYPTDAEAPAMTAMKPNGELAWRRYNGETSITLRDLFGAGLFQLPYLSYSGVFFVDGDLGLSINGEDITETPIAGPAVILPPAQTPEHFVAHIFGRPLDRPVRATRDAKVAIVWKHAGFEDVTTEETISEGEFEPQLPDTSESRKAITTHSFQITAHSGHLPLEECTITVNGKDITDEPTYFTTAELITANVVINCEGYTQYSQRMDLAASTKALIRMQERTKVYCFEMPVKSTDLGSPVDFKIYTKKIITESPIEGYTTQDTIQEGETRINHLYYQSSAPAIVTKVFYVVAGLILGILIGCLTHCGGGKKADTRPGTDKDSVPTEQTQDKPEVKVPEVQPVPQQNAQEPVQEPAQAQQEQPAETQPQTQQPQQQQPATTNNAAAVKTEEYVVKSGDNLGKIAKKYNITVQQLRELNGRTEAEDTKLNIGDKLKVPKN